MSAIPIASCEVHCVAAVELLWMGFFLMHIARGDHRAKLSHLFINFNKICDLLFLEFPPYPPLPYSASGVFVCLLPHDVTVFVFLPMSGCFCGTSAHLASDAVIFFVDVFITG